MRARRMIHHLLLGALLSLPVYAEDAPTAPTSEDAGAAAPAPKAHKVTSYHGGLFHPNGVDLGGYSVEKGTPEGFHWFYTLGFPSFAAAGLSYYDDYAGNGKVATVGIGIGFAAFGSYSYQWHLGDHQYLKAGLGLTSGVAYSGVFPVLSYERRFE